jgi:hypothetical protein
VQSMVIRNCADLQAFDSMTIACRAAGCGGKLDGNYGCNPLKMRCLT